MGHGTTVPNEFDIDLVIYSRGKLYKALYKTNTWELSHAMSIMTVQILVGEVSRVPGSCSSPG